MTEERWTTMHHLLHLLAGLLRVQRGKKLACVLVRGQRVSRQSVLLIANKPAAHRMVIAVLEQPIFGDVQGGKLLQSHFGNRCRFFAHGGFLMAITGRS